MDKKFTLLLHTVADADISFTREDGEEVLIVYSDYIRLEKNADGTATISYWTDDGIDRYVATVKTRETAEEVNERIREAGLKASQAHMDYEPVFKPYTKLEIIRRLRDLYEKKYRQWAKDHDGEYITGETPHFGEYLAYSRCVKLLEAETMEEIDEVCKQSPLEK